MKRLCAVLILLFSGTDAIGEIAVISPAEAQSLIEKSDAANKPVVLDTRGGYKDYFRGHIPTAHHLDFDTLRGTENGVPVQYLPDEITEPLLVRESVRLCCSSTQ